MAPITPWPDEQEATCCCCGNTVSRQADRCPRCGHTEFAPVLMEPPWRVLPARRRVYWIVVYAVALLIAVAITIRIVHLAAWLTGKG